MALTRYANQLVAFETGYKWCHEAGFEAWFMEYCSKKNEGFVIEVPVGFWVGAKKRLGKLLTYSSLRRGVRWKRS
jgi:hypothetical protein